ncbi:MAG: glycosyltransferase family 2 protein [Rhodanobacteraceae bacterium]
MDLAPNDQLRWSPELGGGSWEATGANPRFASAPGQGLAAGWYELRGRLEVADIRGLLPSVYPRYGSHSPLTSTEVMLPLPDAAGRIATLLMFFDEVESLEFYPGVCETRFRMRDFTLRRVSRLRALRWMLGGPRPDSQAPGYTGRAIAWARNVARQGLKPATHELHANYRRRMRPRGFSEYDLWTRRYDTFSRIALAGFERRAQALVDRGSPISVLLPVHDTPERWLRRCLDSVLEQAWQKWELCVVDDDSPAPHVAAVLAEYARRDPRVRVIRRERNGHTAEACETALAMARGEFVALLEPGDELRPHALLRVAETVVVDPELAIVYSDEDKVDADGKRFDPDFKPDWNPDLLRSRNYIRHFAAIRTTLAREAGGFRAGFEDSHDYDLILRCSEKAEPRQVHHIAEILYHDRAAESSATMHEADDGASTTATRALAEHLQRIGADARVDSVDPSRALRRVRWPIPVPAPKISLIVPTRDRADLLRICLESILAKSTYPDFELVVVDNQSRNADALEYLRELEGRERVRVLRYDAPFNYSAINNWAARQCDGRLLGLVNNDIEVITPDWLEEMAGFALRHDTGAVGAMLYYPDDTIQHAGVLLGMLGVAGHIYGKMPRGYPGYAGRGRVAQNLSAVTGACMLVRREVFEEVGGLDEQLPVAFNDIDFCLRIRGRGYRNVWTPFAELYHHESASRGKEDTIEKLARFASEVEFMRQRWGDALREDPAYNPNLSLQSQNFELAFPPRRLSA